MIFKMFIHFSPILFCSETYRKLFRVLSNTYQLETEAPLRSLGFNLRNNVFLVCFPFGIELRFALADVKETDKFTSPISSG